VCLTRQLALCLSLADEHSLSSSKQSKTHRWHLRFSSSMSAQSCPRYLPRTMAPRCFVIVVAFPGVARGSEQRSQTTLLNLPTAIHTSCGLEFECEWGQCCSLAERRALCRVRESIRVVRSERTCPTRSLEACSHRKHGDAARHCCCWHSVVPPLVACSPLTLSRLYAGHSLV